jgi:NADPH:quinone reductase-like Zn-dependent oxidoreductase
VLILGASGGVATAAIQIAKLAGTVVLAVTSSTEKVKKALELGADVAFDRLSEDWSREVWLRTAKRGVDVVVENVGAATWRDSLRSLAAGGRIVTYGATAGYQAETDLRHVYYRQLTILGSTMASFAEFGQVMDLVDGGRLDPVVSHSLSLDDIRRGHEILEAGQQFGKVVITL